jgi:hypothetical protein
MARAARLNISRLKKVSRKISVQLLLCTLTHRALIAPRADDYIGVAGAGLALAHSRRISHTQTLI